ncbi:MAG: CYTH domain-containing protein [Thomasclavelia sp.]|nr:CYTH domain-containing protein [Thomasclavelia sp.]
MEHNEIEFKMLISKEIYNKIIKDYSNKISKQYLQTNYYLSSKELDNKRYMLRLRVKDDCKELTLKKSGNISRKEINLSINDNEYSNIKDKHIYNNEISKMLEEEGIDISKISYSNYLTTNRSDIIFDNGVLSIDENDYNGIIDYEIEYEVIDQKLGYEEFLDIIKPYNLKYMTNSLPKYVRMKNSIK